MPLSQGKDVSELFQVPISGGQLGRTFCKHFFQEGLALMRRAGKVPLLGQGRGELQNFDVVIGFLEDQQLARGAQTFCNAMPIMIRKGSTDYGFQFRTRLP